MTPTEAKAVLARYPDLAAIDPVLQEALDALAAMIEENERLTAREAKLRRDVEACQHSNPDRPGLMYWNDAMRKVLALIDQQEAGE